MPLQIAHIEYSITTKSIDIFTIGCDGLCTDCCNPEIKDWNLKGLSVEETCFKIRELYKQFPKLIQRVLIVGGDPVDGELHSNGGVSTIIDDIKLYANIPIFLFTRHQLDVVPQSLKDRADYIKTGPYIPELTCEDNIQYGIKLATSNQHIFTKEDWKNINE